MKKSLTFTQLIITILTIGIIGCLAYISNAQLDNREAALVSIILALLSIVASYIASHYFSEKGHKEALEEVKAQHVENLKTYAINAAEKVDNLSKELHRLSIFLEDELAKEFSDPLQALHSRTDKITSAVHIIETLKSVNDTSLSDWRGVIPEELEEKNEEQLERETELKELIDRVEELSLMGMGNGINYKYKGEDLIKDEIDQLRLQLIDVSRKIDGVKIRPKKGSAKPLRESVSAQCISCGQQISYKQRPMKNSFVPVTCQECGTQYTARWYTDKGFSLEPSVEKEENIACPFCEQSISFKLYTLVFSSTQVTCPKCHAAIKVTRNISGIKTKNINGPRIVNENNWSLTEETIQQIQKAMPPQPWPKGTHRNIIESLGISKNVFDRAIQILISRGVFHPQVDGVLYYKKGEAAEHQVVPPDR